METIRSTRLLKIVQEDVAAWADKNFGPDRPFNDAGGLHPLLGIMEEVGELCHARLKADQGIRIVDPADEMDAVGDILIYILHYCSRRGFDAAEVLQKTWEKVRQRDWKTDPVGGTQE
jgi:NTP pyrophosphatase (non-canonical NTP hydrolase)